MSEALKGTVIQEAFPAFLQSANQGMKDFSKPAGLGKDSIKGMTGRGTIDTGTDFFLLCSKVWTRIGSRFTYFTISLGRYRLSPVQGMGSFSIKKVPV